MEKVRRFELFWVFKGKNKSFNFSCLTWVVIVKSHQLLTLAAAASNTSKSVNQKVFFKFYSLKSMHSLINFKKKKAIVYFFIHKAQCVTDLSHSPHLYINNFLWSSVSKLHAMRVSKWLKVNRKIKYALLSSVFCLWAVTLH